MTFKSGLKATATLNGTEIALTNWSVRPSVERAMFKNSKSGRVPLREATFVDLTGTVSFDFDYDANAFATMSVVPGQKITNLKLYLGNGSTGIFHSIPSALVVETPQDAAVDGKINSSFNFETDGVYTLAGGISPAGLLG